MSTNELLQHIYSEQLSNRQNMQTRIQLNLAIYLAIFTMLSYMLRMLDYNAQRCVIISFFFFLSIGILPLLISCYYTVNAFIIHDYRVFPSAKKSLEYKSELKNHCGDPKDVEIAFDEFVFDSFAECIDVNYTVNEGRALSIRRALLGVLISLAPLIISALLFIFSDLDASSPRKNQLNEDIALRTSIEKSMGIINNSLNLLIEDETKMTEKNTQESQNKGTNEQPKATSQKPPERPPTRVSKENFKEPDSKK